MDSDFNPFDLSAPPKVIEKKPEVQEFSAEAKVHRVSMGPLFHSKLTRVLATVLSLVLFGLIGYIGMDYYLLKKQISPQTSNTLMLQLGISKSA